MHFILYSNIWKLSSKHHVLLSINTRFRVSAIWWLCFSELPGTFSQSFPEHFQSIMADTRRTVVVPTRRTPPGADTVSSGPVNTTSTSSTSASSSSSSSSGASSASSKSKASSSSSSSYRPTAVVPAAARKQRCTLVCARLNTYCTVPVLLKYI